MKVSGLATMFIAASTRWLATASRAFELAQ